MAQTNPLAPLLIRIGLGSILFFHGLQKLLYISRTIEFFQLIELPAPPIAAYVIATAEILCGIAFFLGIHIRLASLCTILLMCGTIITVKGTKGFINGYEFDVLIMLNAISLIFLGPGEHSISHISNQPYGNT
ncbi:DoxX family protein [Laceyella putida]|uniref:DoxX family protein n=1 Tax=Laceyella putida TaxID=110101 RepID=A0ABW2RKA1_9BACL